MSILRLFSCLLLSIVLFTGCESGSTEQGGNSGGTTPPANDIELMPGQTGDIQFSHIRMEFQPVTAGDTVHASYPFKNVSKKTVTIDNVITSCNCIQAEFPRQKLIPGEIGEIKVHFHTEGMAKEVPTTHEKMFPVQIDGILEPIETLHLTGKVIPNGQ